MTRRMNLDLSLYVIIDPEHLGGHNIATLAHGAVLGGATILQYRSKNLSTREQVRDVRILKSAISGRRVPLLVNDRVDVALAAGADGVHLGRDDMDVGEARRLMGPRAIIGQTVKSDADADALSPAADYACIGGVFATLSKNNPDAPLGLDGLKALRSRIAARFADLPVGAIAGITDSTAAEVIAAGADGVAVISAVSSHADAAEAARSLKAAVSGALARRGEDQA